MTRAPTSTNKRPADGWFALWGQLAVSALVSALKELFGSTISSHQPKHVWLKVLGAVWRADTIVPLEVPCTKPHTRHSNKHTLATDTRNIPESFRSTIGRQEPPARPGPEASTKEPRAGRHQALAQSTRDFPRTIIRPKAINKEPRADRPQAQSPRVSPGTRPGHSTTTKGPRANLPQATGQNMVEGGLVPEGPDLDTRQELEQGQAKPSSSS